MHNTEYLSRLDVGSTDSTHNTVTIAEKRMEAKLANGLETLKRHLRLNVLHCALSEIEQLVLEFGHPYFGIKRPKGFRLGRPKQCFMNATLAVCEDDASLDDISYVEGFAMKTDPGHVFPFSSCMDCLR